MRLVRWKSTTWLRTFQPLRCVLLLYKPTYAQRLLYTCPCLLYSNTRLSNIFREFSKGMKAESDPVAVLISWSQKRAAGHSSSTTPSCAIGVAAAERPKRQRQHQAAILHLTTRDLHAFLFGASRDYHPFPTATSSTPAAAVAARRGKRRRTGSLKSNGTRNVAADLGPPFCHTDGGGILDDGSTKVYSKCFANATERSEAAANAAGEGEGGGDGGGWCLLQKFIGPAGSRSSTLRLANNMRCCRWLASKMRL